MSYAFRFSWSSTGLQDESKPAGRDGARWYSYSGFSFHLLTADFSFCNLKGLSIFFSTLVSEVHSYHQICVV